MKSSSDNAASGISVKYIYSACVVTRTPNVRVLHDPWFTDGVYDGSWFHFPEVQDPLGLIGEVDLIYVSHIHPDHYDSAFIKRYFERYGNREIIIADHAPNHLVGKMQADGFRPTVLRAARRVGATTIEILPHRTGSVADIDSSIVIKYHDDDRVHCVVNTNDIIFDEPMTRMVKQAAGDIDILLCGYTGAGPYPQTYFDLDDPRLPLEAQKKKEAFFARYRKLIGAMDARVNIPFAGKYVLGGKLAELNKFRGVADATEVLAFDPRAVVLADAGGEISTSDPTRFTARTKPYDEIELERRIRAISDRAMDYERLINAAENHQLPVRRLLVAAARKAVQSSELESNYFFVIALPGGDRAVINACKGAEKPIVFQPGHAPLPEPRSEIDIDVRYLFGLLTNIYHWNNAEVGSQYATRRVPNEFNRKAQSFLSFLRV